MTGARFDAIVVGAGNAALCAAIAAAEAGIRVLVLERAPRDRRGGNSWFTDGAIRFAHGGLADVRPLIPSMTDEEADRIDLPAYPVDRFVEDLARMSDGRADPKLARILAAESLPTMRWMAKQAIPFGMLYRNQSFDVNGRRSFWGGLAVAVEGGGIGLIDRLMERVGELGVEIRYGARAVGIRRLADRALEVRAETPDGPARVSAPAVVLACGGFEASSEGRARHLGPKWADVLVRGSEFNEGDGHRMALDLGAAPAGDWGGCHAVAMDARAPKFGDHGKPGDIYKRHSYPLGILVNALGRRFLDEGADFRNYTYVTYGRAILEQPGGIAYQVFDQQVAPRLREEYEREETTRYEAETPLELARRMGIDAEAFASTVEGYNQAVAEGPYDPSRLDGKAARGIDPPKSNWALRLEEPPFLAFPVRCGITFTFGGLAVDERARVLDRNGAPIAGLLAAGEMVGGLFYGNYPGGAGLMSGAVFGRIAGTTAARISEEAQ